MTFWDDLPGTGDGQATPALPASPGATGSSFWDEMQDVTPAEMATGGAPVAAGAPSAPKAQGGGFHPLEALARTVISHGGPSPASLVGEVARSVPGMVTGAVRSMRDKLSDVFEAPQVTTESLIPLATEGATYAVGSPLQMGPGIVERGASGQITRVLPRLSPWEQSLFQLRRAARERSAGERLVGAAENPDEAIRTAGGASELVPGSKPTLGQATGDKGLLAAEREAILNPDNRAEFLQRGEEQKQAQVGALQGMQGEGRPQAVPETLKRHMETIDNDTQAAIDRATGEAQAAAERTGGAGTAEGYGESLRKATQDVLAVEKEHERALWNAVDPDGRLRVNMGPMKEASDGVYGGLSKAQNAGLTADETKIKNVIGEYGGVEPFREITDLRSMITSAMRAERRANGESPAFRRLTQLRGAVEDALSASAGETATKEIEIAGKGAMLPADTLAARIGAETPKTGNVAYTAGGREVPVRYRVVEGDQLTTSHRADLTPNPDFPQELQPRDRARASSVAQVTRMSRRLQSERLGASASVGEGAPIVGPDGLVESGNARVLAIRQAYREGGHNAQSYRDFLKSQGFDTEGMREPVLVRERTGTMTPEERIAFTKEANVSSTLHTSAAERAASDASKLSDDTLGRFKGGEVRSAENRDFVRDFSRNAVERSEESAFATKDGKLSLEGERRITNALTHAAYGDTNLVARLAESGDESIRAFGQALMDAAGEMAQLRRAIDAGQVSSDVDLAPHILHAVDIVGEARAKGIPLAQIVAQRDAFAPVDQVAEMVLQEAYGPDLSGRISRRSFTNELRSYVKEALQQTTEARLIGEPLRADQILESAGARRVARSSGGGADTGGAAGTQSVERGRPSAPASGARPSRESASVIEQAPEAPANFDAAARERLGAATSATQQRVDKFGKGPQKEILRSLGNKGDFRIPDAEVGRRIFKPGPAGQASVEAFRKAVGDGAAMATLQDYIASRLRAVAMRADGTLDPKKTAGFMRSHADGLRAFPELKAKFSSAEKASSAIEEAAIARAEALKQFQGNEVKKLISAESDADVARIVGGVFGRDDAVRRISDLVSRVRSNPDALAGLRAAVIDHIYDRMVGNKEIGTTGLRGLKEGIFSDFVRKNAAALRVALPESDVKMLEALSDDILRSKRTLESVRVLPGQSNTAQDMWKLVEDKLGGGNHSMFDNVFGWAILAHEVGSGNAAVAAVAGGKIVGKIISMMRRNGINKVETLVKQGMLDPALGRSLMLRAREQNVPRFSAALGRYFARNLVRGTLGNAQNKD